MTYYYYQEKPVTWKDFWYNFKQNLKTAGWVVNSSSTGSSFGAGDLLTTSAAVNTNGWINLEHPILDGYQRSLCIQFGSNIYNARIKIAWAPFTTGATATQSPGSTDERILLGAGSDASPTFANISSNITTSLANNVYCSAGDLSEKYSFYLFSFLTNTSQGITTVQTTFIMQYIKDAHAQDIDPYIYQAVAGNNYPTSWQGGGTTNPSGWYKKGLTGATWTTFSSCQYGGDLGPTNLYGLLGTNIYDNKVNIYPMIMGRSQAHTTQLGIKGTLRDIGVTFTARMNLYSISNLTTRDKIYFGPYFVINHNGQRVAI